MIYNFDSFWLNFTMTTSQYGTRISRFRENSFINKYLTSKFLLLLVAVFLWPLVQEIQIWALLWVNFGLMTSLRGQKCNDRMKFCSFSVLKQVLFISTNFRNDSLKTCPNLRNLAFLLITSQIKYKYCHNFECSFDFIWPAVLLRPFSEGASLNKIKFHKIRCRSWIAVPL